MKYICIVLVMLLMGCTTLTESARTPIENIELYNCYWGCADVNGKTGWVCGTPVPVWDRNFKDCDNATADRIMYGETCPATGIRSSVEWLGRTKFER